MSAELRVLPMPRLRVHLLIDAGGTNFTTHSERPAAELIRAALSAPAVAVLCPLPVPPPGNRSQKKFRQRLALQQGGLHGCRSEAAVRPLPFPWLFCRIRRRPG